jgi:hypothetical protein
LTHHCLEEENIKSVDIPATYVLLYILLSFFSTPFLEANTLLKVLLLKMFSQQRKSGHVMPLPKPFSASPLLLKKQNKTKKDPQTFSIAI